MATSLLVTIFPVSVGFAILRYRQRYDAEKALETFAARARDEVELDRLTSHLVAIIQETMQPSKASLWMPKR